MTARVRFWREVAVDLAYLGWALSGLLLAPFLWVAAKVADLLFGRRAADWGKHV